MESLNAAPLPAPLGSRQSGPVLRSSKRRRTSRDGSCSTDMGPVVTAFSDTFDGNSNTTYKRCLESVQPTDTSLEYASFVTKKVAVQANVVWNWDNSVSSSGSSAVHDAHISSQHNFA